MANAVKSWVAEWEARNSAVKTAAASLIRSLEDSRPNPTPQFRFNHRRTDYLFGKRFRVLTATSALQPAPLAWSLVCFLSIKSGL